MFRVRIRIAAAGGLLVLLDLLVALIVWNEAAGSATLMVVGLLAVGSGLGLAALFPPVAPEGRGPRAAGRGLYAAGAGAAIVLLALGRAWQVAGLGVILGILAGSTPALLRRRSRQLERFRHS